jgi:hypothetical protein
VLECAHTPAGLCVWVGGLAEVMDFFVVVKYIHCPVVCASCEARVHLRQVHTRTRLRQHARFELGGGREVSSSLRKSCTLVPN